MGAANPNADAYWSLDDPGPRSRWVSVGRVGIPFHKNLAHSGWCSKQPDGLAGFGSCLNSGVFIMRNNDWTQGWMQRTLDLSNKSIAETCSTRGLNPSHFDQCDAFPKLSQQRVGDKCVITCDAFRHADTLAHFQSFRPNHSPRFQEVVVARFRFPLEVKLRPPPHIARDTFVVNCAGHVDNFQSMLDCVKYISNFADTYKPERSASQT